VLKYIFISENITAMHISSESF